MVTDAASCESLTEIGRWVVFRREDSLGTTTQGMSHLQDLPETETYTWTGFSIR